MNKTKLILFKTFSLLTLVLCASCSENDFSTEETTKEPLLISSQSHAMTSVRPVIALSDSVPGSSNNYRITTHSITSGSSGFQLGVTNKGGGVINQIIIPGLGDIMGNESDLYGRAGQVAIRDTGHSGVYNPTQAGFNELQGTPCTITQSADGKKLTIRRRPMSLWHGDGKYDFTRWENIGEGSKKNDLKNADRDELPEENLPGKQLTEVRSEFDYFGTYTDISGRNGINIGIIKHEYEISFIRPPGHCINQFREGTTVYNANALQANIAVNAPQGVYPGTDKDMNRMIGIWSLRHDATLWRPGQYYYRAKNGNWNRQTANVASNLDGAPTDSDGTTVMIAASVDMDKGRALCLYRPKTVKNTDVIIGRDSDKRTVYRDSRRNKIKVIYDLGRSTVISKYGFSSRLKGMINRTQFNQGIYAGRGVYEVYRNDIYILYGTPNEIIDAIALLDTSLGL